MYLASGLNTAEVTKSLCPVRTTGSPVPSAAHIRAVPSSEVVRTRLASGDREMFVTLPAWWSKARTLPLAECHDVTVPSSDAVKMYIPSGVNFALVIGAECISTAISDPSRFHSRAVWSSDAVTTLEPSGLNSALVTLASLPTSGILNEVPRILSTLPVAPLQPGIFSGLSTSRRRATETRGSFSV